MTRELALLFHFLGLGLFVTIQVAGFVLEFQYKKAPDLQTKAVILRALRPIGLLSPVAVVIMIITGLINMNQLAIEFSTFMWLQEKLAVFVVAVVVGVFFGIRARKRGALVASMIQGKAPNDAETQLRGLDKQIMILSIVMPILFLAVVYLAVQGRLGAQ